MTDLKKALRDVSYRELMTFCDVIVMEHGLDQPGAEGRAPVTPQQLAGTIFDWASYSEYKEEAAE